uniref:Uncharacterized protein n=1 Tax=Plectus sambesii TaxID=2011161 RepID=A0A914VA09_9BILA
MKKTFIVLVSLYLLVALTEAVGSRGAHAGGRGHHRRGASVGNGVNNGYGNYGSYGYYPGSYGYYPGYNPYANQIQYNGLENLLGFGRRR